ncbi:hypothetical protein MKX01_011146 [Papaver californicum]|nr:hypothetical protein MKX01_011146 [Papaver californicum]
MNLFSCSCYPTPVLISSSKQKHRTKPSLSKSSTSLPSINTQTNNFFASYAKSKTLDQTLQLFQLLPTQDTLTWNTLLSACLNQSQFTTTINLFFQMISSDASLIPDILTFRWVLRACSENKNYSLAFQIHAYMTKIYGPCSPDLITSTCLISIYSEFGSIKYARQLFDIITDRDVVAFTSMMVGYNNANEYAETVGIFESMVRIYGLTPNGFIFTCILTALASLSSLVEGEQIHAYIVKTSFQSDVFVGTALIRMYSKCDRMDCAEKAFLEIEIPNVVSWNALMGGSFSGRKVLQFFTRMRGSGLRPDHVTLAHVLQNIKDLDLFSAQQIHSLIIKMIGEEVDVYIGGALVEIYTKYGFIRESQRVFDSIRGKDITAFNLAIRGYIRDGHTSEAYRLFYAALQMSMEPSQATLKSLMIRTESQKQGKQFHAMAVKFGYGDNSNSDGSIASLLIIMYSEYHCFDDAIRLFNGVHSPDLILWTSIISGFSRSGNSQEAVKFYARMWEELDKYPNNYTFSSVLRSCSDLAAVEEGKQIHCQIIKLSSDIGSVEFVSSGLLEMYAKSGYIEEAKKLFNKTLQRDIATWNSMIMNLAQHGDAANALEIFAELLGLPNLEPNHITYVGVLSACNHKGLVEEGYQYFKMIKDPTIDHYTCLIDLLGRAGSVAEALSVIEQMPFDPNEIIWSSLLAANALHGNVDLGEYSANQLLQLNPKDSGTYVALSNIYAAAGRWNDVDLIRKLMKAQGVRKNPGQSFLTVNRLSRTFLAAEG